MNNQEKNNETYLLEKNKLEKVVEWYILLNKILKENINIYELDINGKYDAKIIFDNNWNMFSTKIYLNGEKIFQKKILKELLNKKKSTIIINRNDIKNTPIVLYTYKKLLENDTLSLQDKLLLKKNIIKNSFWDKNTQELLLLWIVKEYINFEEDYTWIKNKYKNFFEKEVKEEKIKNDDLEKLYWMYWKYFKEMVKDISTNISNNFIKNIVSDNQSSNLFNQFQSNNFQNNDSWINKNKNYENDILKKITNLDKISNYSKKTNDKEIWDLWFLWYWDNINVDPFFNWDYWIDDYMKSKWMWWNGNNDENIKWEWSFDWSWKLQNNWIKEEILDKNLNEDDFKSVNDWLLEEIKDSFLKKDDFISIFNEKMEEIKDKKNEDILDVFEWKYWKWNDKNIDNQIFLWEFDKKDSDDDVIDINSISKSIFNNPENLNDEWIFEIISDNNDEDLLTNKEKKENNKVIDEKRRLKAKEIAKKSLETMDTWNEEDKRNKERILSKLNEEFYWKWHKEIIEKTIKIKSWYIIVFILVIIMLIWMLFLYWDQFQFNDIKYFFQKIFWMFLINNS